MRNLFIAATFSLFMVPQCHAVSWEWPIDPIESEVAGDDIDGEASFREAMKGENKCGGWYDEKLCNQYKEKMAEAIAKGNIKARLVRGTEGDILNAFQTVDQSNDSKLIYEVGALMWRENHLACLNVIEENGVSRVERKCHNEKNTISFEEKRIERRFGYILKAANMGYPPAQYAIGFILQQRYTRATVGQVGYLPANIMEQVEISGMQPLDWIKRAAEAGSKEAILLLSNIQKEEQKKTDKNENIAATKRAHDAIKPKCTKIRFTGVATAGPWELLETVLASKDIEDMLARNPIVCSSGGMGDMYADSEGKVSVSPMRCRGFDYFKSKLGTIFNWSAKYLTITTDYDFSIGRRPIMMTIRRGDATCIN